MQFQEINLGTGRDVNGIYFVNDSVGFAAGGERYTYGDIFKTTDGGNNWIAQNSGIPKAVYKPFFLNMDTGYAAAYEGKLLRTTDGGSNWQLYQSYWLTARDIKFVNDSAGYACGGTGFGRGIIFRTTNRGDTWSIDTFQNELRSLFFTGEKTGYCSGYGIILKTTDGGINWNPTTAKGDFFTSVYFTNTVTGYAAGMTGTILKTTDAGETWKKLHSNNSLVNKNRNFTRIIFRNASVGYAVGWNGLMIKTTNGGEDWIIVTNAPQADFKDIFLLSKGGFIAAGGGKLYRFSD